MMKRAAYRGTLFYRISDINISLREIGSVGGMLAGKFEGE